MTCVSAPPASAMKRAVALPVSILPMAACRSAVAWRWPRWALRKAWPGRRQPRPAARRSSSWKAATARSGARRALMPVAPVALPAAGWRCLMSARAAIWISAAPRNWAPMRAVAMAPAVVRPRAAVLCWALTMAMSRCVPGWSSAAMPSPAAAATLPGARRAAVPPTSAVPVLAVPAPARWRSAAIWRYLPLPSAAARRLPAAAVPPAARHGSGSASRKRLSAERPTETSRQRPTETSRQRRSVALRRCVPPRPAGHRHWRRAARLSAARCLLMLLAARWRSRAALIWQPVRLPAPGARAAMPGPARRDCAWVQPAAPAAPAARGCRWQAAAAPVRAEPAGPPAGALCGSKWLRPGVCWLSARRCSMARQPAGPVTTGRVQMPAARTCGCWAMAGVWRWPA